MRNRYRALIQIFITPENKLIYAIISRQETLKLVTLNKLIEFMIVNYVIHSDGSVTPVKDWVAPLYITQRLELTDRDYGTKYNISDPKAYKKFILNWANSYKTSKVYKKALDEV